MRFNPITFHSLPVYIGSGREEEGGRSEGSGKTRREERKKNIEVVEERNERKWK